MKQSSKEIINIISILQKENTKLFELANEFLEMSINGAI
jgi:hypothetical protein